MRICFVPSDFDGPGSYRCLFPALELRKLGHASRVCDTKPVMHADGNRRFHVTLPDPNVADIFVVHRRFELAALEWARALKRVGKIVVASTDDNDLNLPSWHSAFGKGQGETPGVSRVNWHKLVQMADVLLCSTEHLARSYRFLNKNTYVIPNYLDKRMWEDVKPKDWDRLRVGWMGAPGIRLGDLEVLKPVLAPWLKRHPEVDFVSAGDADTHEILGIPEAQRVTIDGIPFIERRLAEMLRFDIGLVPLAGCPFNESKSHLKGMEYAAVEIPAIASNTANYRDWLAGGGGSIILRQKGWFDALDALLDDSFRSAQARVAREHAERNWLEDHIGEWEDFFFGLEPPYWLSDKAVSLGAVQKVNELEPLLELVRERKPQVIAEIGTAAGGTFHALAHAAPDDATLISIDLPGADGYTYMQEVDFPKLAALVKPTQEVHFIRGDSHDPETRRFLEDRLDGRSIDFLFIDGDHSYEGVKADFELYSPLASMVAFHDIIKHPPLPTACDVDVFWNEIKGGYAYREFIDKQHGQWGGIGVLEMPRLRENALAA